MCLHPHATHPSLSLLNRLIEVIFTDINLWLAFEFMDLDLKKLIDETATLLEPDLVRVCPAMHPPRAHPPELHVSAVSRRGVLPLARCAAPGPEAR